MNDVPSPNLRISDADRESALSALGDHLAVGRLDVDEYGERSAKVTTAKTRGELAEIFTDLPAPHPTFGEAPKPEPAKAVERKREGELTYADRPVAQRFAAGLVPVGFVAALALFFTVGGWWWFAIPFVVLAVGQGLWGKDWEKDPNRERERRRRHDERHRRRDDRDRRWS